jgi:hypothetical protein
MRRLFSGLGLALAALSIMSSTALAGGWAWVTADNPPPGPRAGETVDFGFTVLQHGQTPIDWATATVVARNTDTGTQKTFPAAPKGKTGHYASQITLTDAGTYTFEVRLAELEVQSGPLTVTVRTAAGALPGAAEADAANAQLALELRAMNERMAALEAKSSAEVPAPAVVAMAGLAGALSALVVVGLGRRRRGEETASAALVPNPR